MELNKYLEKLLKILSGVLVTILTSFALFVISLLIILAIKITNSRTKYEFYSLDGEKGYSYHCEVKEKVQCEVDGNMIEVSQFSEVEK